MPFDLNYVSIYSLVAHERSLNVVKWTLRRDISVLSEEQEVFSSFPIKDVTLRSLKKSGMSCQLALNRLEMEAVYFLWHPLGHC